MAAPTANDEAAAKRPKIQPSRFFAGHAERRGAREAIEDVCVVQEQLDLQRQACARISSAAYFACFDGHAGRRAADHCAEHMLPHILAHLPSLSDFGSKECATKIRKSLGQAFAAEDREFLALARAGQPQWKDGCTATVCLALNDVLFTANVGDAKAILVRYKEAPTVADTESVLPMLVDQDIATLVLTKDHNPVVYEERQRIQKAGGSVTDNRVQGVLGVSRSIGDGRYKHLGVSSQPFTSKCTLDPNKDLFLVLACDGLWGTLSASDVIQFCMKAFGEAEQDDQLAGQPKLQATHVAARLANHAVEKGASDNVSVLLVRFATKP
ncbi:uncharacterized protein MONBRDRAFT_36991 [Monosiga brevicollis MX1]|uniref:PPM-type phosphatase domain-containing protein n=1 Tax=Monosiga brevicollis TaxID=81824 RepID=A9UYV7_MONBE|nr:uncharacterized protein MONBRDRAFT_36991 [Monosiga brevicollis MX1]EDQ89528.1 predicted protein [Monosiga brevicollis MX1]|eukprot:XP_001745557.1 hypothetical protein [Monosiga brevicollis MX1]